MLQQLTIAAIFFSSQRGFAQPVSASDPDSATVRLQVVDERGATQDYHVQSFRPVVRQGSELASLFVGMTVGPVRTGRYIVKVRPTKARTDIIARDGLGRCREVEFEHTIDVRLKGGNLVTIAQRLQCQEYADLDLIGAHTMALVPAPRGNNLWVRVVALIDRVDEDTSPADSVVSPTGEFRLSAIRAPGTQIVTILDGSRVLGWAVLSLPRSGKPPARISWVAYETR